LTPTIVSSNSKHLGCVLRLVNHVDGFTCESSERTCGFVFEMHLIRPVARF